MLMQTIFKILDQKLNLSQTPYTLNKNTIQLRYETHTIQITLHNETITCNYLWHRDAYIFIDTKPKRRYTQLQLSDPTLINELYEYIKGS